MLLLVLLLVLTGCGYQFRVQGQGPTIGADETAPPPQGSIPRLVIHTFRNEAFEPNLELKYTEYTRDEFEAGSGALVVNRGEPTDLVLSGRILNVTTPALSFTRQTTLENRVTVTVQAEITDQRADRVIWRQTSTASGEYFVTDDLQFNRVLQTRALEQAGRAIAQDLATRFLADRQRGTFESPGTSASPTPSGPVDPTGEPQKPARPESDPQP